MLCNQRGGGDRPHAGRAGNAVRGVSAQCNEIRHLRRSNAVTRPDLFRADPGKFSRADGLHNGGAFRGKLERIAVATRDDACSASALFACDRRSEEVVGLVARRLG